MNILVQLILMNKILPLAQFYLNWNHFDESHSCIILIDKIRT